MRANKLLIIAWLSLPAYGQDAQCTGEVEVSCETASGNSDGTTCLGVHISDCTHDISGGRATTQELATGSKTWQLADEIRLAFGTTVIEADSAVFRFEADELGQDQLVYAELVGQPVRMSDYEAESGTLLYTGTANSIDLDSRNTTLRLLGEATLIRGSDEREGFEGCDWIYNWGDHSFRAGATDCGGIRVTLAPPEDSEGPEVQPETP